MFARLERRCRRSLLQHRSPRSDPWDGSWRSARPHARSARPHARSARSVAVGREHRALPIQAAVELEFAASARLRPSKTETPHRCEVSSLFRKSGWRDLNPRPFDPQSNALPNCATTRKEGKDSSMANPRQFTGDALIVGLSALRPLPAGSHRRRRFATV